MARRAGGLLADDALEIVPLGGLGEFGMNMMAVSCGETTVVIDAGAMFPGPELLGVDLIVPDLSYLQDRRVSALILTHGHEDHIGGVPYVWRLLDGPVYGTPLTLALVEPKLEEHEIDPVVGEGDVLENDVADAGVRSAGCGMRGTGWRNDPCRGIQ